MPDIQFCNMQAVRSISVVELLWMLVDVLSGACAADLVISTVSMFQIFSLCRSYSNKLYLLYNKILTTRLRPITILKMFIELYFICIAQLLQLFIL